LLLPVVMIIPYVSFFFRKMLIVDFVLSGEAEDNEEKEVKGKKRYGDFVVDLATME